MLQLENVSHHYNNSSPILKNINLTIKQGEFVAIIGPSGSGKSTLLNLLGCLDKPATGKYFLNDIVINTLPEIEMAELRSKTFGFIFQNYYLLPTLSIVENVALPATYCGTPRNEAIQNAKLLLTSFKLKEKFHTLPGTLSGGQQQRVCVSRALMNGAQVILADEPTGALDQKTGQEVISALRMLHLQGHTLILVTHDLHIAQQAQRIITITDGEIISDERKNTFLPSISAMSSELNRRTMSRSPLSKIKDSIRMAFHCLFAHPLRTTLTSFGIIMGIAAVTSVVGLGTGAQEKVISDIRSIGSDTISIYPDQTFESTNKITPSVYSQLSLSSGLHLISPKLELGVNANYRGEQIGVKVIGVNEEYPDIIGLKTIAGNFFNRNHVSNNASYAVIDTNIKNTLFKKLNPLGQQILINNSYFTITGVMDSVSADGKDTVWIPYTTYLTRLSGGDKLDSVIMKFYPFENPAINEKNIWNLINKNKDISGYRIYSSFQVREAIENTSNTLTWLILSVALISLIIAGAGVMNMMLISVTERTSEIGLRIAMGATRFDILSQFLIESIFICVVSGIIGGLLSWLISLSAPLMFSVIPIVFSPLSLLLSLLCSLLIGIIFGFIPAYKASRLSPIIALSGNV